MSIPEQPFAVPPLFREPSTLRHSVQRTSRDRASIHEIGTLAPSGSCSTLPPVPTTDINFDF